MSNPILEVARPIRKRVDGLIGLARYREYLFFVVVTTLLGAAAARGSFGWDLIRVLFANWLGVAFAFMINDIEDASDDALNPAKAQRNPVSCSKVSHRLARIATALVAVFALLVYLSLGLLPFLTGLASIALGFLYSWRPVRLKAIPVADLISHCLMLAGLQFLAAYFTFGPPPGDPWLFPFVFVVTVSLYGELFNELRDFEGDRAAGLRHTASYLGPAWTHRVMMALLAVSVSAAIAAIVVDRLIPSWVLYVLGGAALVLLTRPVLGIRLDRPSAALHEPFQKPLEMAAALALLAQFLGPWAAARINFALLWTLH